MVARFAPERFSPPPLALSLLAVFGLDRLPLPSSLEFVAEDVALAVLFYFLYRSDLVLK